MSANIRVLVADDHALFREGIRQVLTEAAGFEVVAETGNGADALRQIERTRPDVVLLDITMPDMSGLEVATELQRQGWKPRILMLSVHDHAEYVLQGVRAGASGYLRKDTSPTELRAAVRAVARGDEFFSPIVAARLAQLARRPDRGTQDAGLDVLTPREQEVLTGIVNGDTNKEIAAALGISVRTVETHRESIMKKLGIRTVAGLTRFALSSGSVELRKPRP